MQESLPIPIETASCRYPFETLFRSQVFKYLVAGVTTAVVDLLIYHLMTAWVNPCEGAEVSNQMRSIHFALNKSASFAIANAMSYWLSVRWVFDGGKHKRLIEVGLFFVGSTVSYSIGMQTGRVVIETFGTPSHFAAVLCIGVATVLNFAARKLFVFRR
jgi:putative flippase GtrA